jgi:hypothetical protein
MIDKTFPLFPFILFALLSTAGQCQDSLDQVTKRSFFERGKINGNLSYIMGRVSDFNRTADGQLDFSRPVYRVRNTIGLNLGINLFERVYFRSTFYYNLNRHINSEWLKPDFAYTIERAKWDPNSFSYGYINYELNQYSNSLNEFLQNFAKGSLFVRYYNRLPNKWIKAVRFDSTGSLSYSVTLKYAIKYVSQTQETAGGLFTGKPVIGVNLRYVFIKDMYLEGTALCYLRPKTRLSYDPDFTYGFGYNTYHHLSFGFSYGNYSSNRYPWNKKEIKNYNFLDGSFSVLLNYSW